MYACNAHCVCAMLPHRSVFTVFVNLATQLVYTVKCTYHAYMYTWYVYPHGMYICFTVYVM